MDKPYVGVDVKNLLSYVRFKEVLVVVEEEKGLPKDIIKEVWNYVCGDVLVVRPYLRDCIKLNCNNDKNVPFLTVNDDLLVLYSESWLFGQYPFCDYELIKELDNPYQLPDVYSLIISRCLNNLNERVKRVIQAITDNSNNVVNVGQIREIMLNLINKRVKLLNLHDYAIPFNTCFKINGVVLNICKESYCPMHGNNKLLKGADGCIKCFRIYPNSHKYYKYPYINLIPITLKDLLNVEQYLSLNILDKEEEKDCKDCKDSKDCKDCKNYMIYSWETKEGEEGIVSYLFVIATDLKKSEEFFTPIGYKTEDMNEYDVLPLDRKIRLNRMGIHLTSTSYYTSEKLFFLSKCLKEDFSTKTIAIKYGKKEDNLFIFPDTNLIIHQDDTGLLTLKGRLNWKGTIDEIKPLISIEVED